ncbi:MAG TPA: hypothetical protein VHZ98_15970 [Galbitalea sp.]|jgi:hypothetical protein|nr:hypothetical protein [Galbitalea sp.]
MALTEAEKEARAEKRRIAAAQRAEDDALRHEARRRVWHEKGMYLTREQAAAGEPCRGCGLPVIDNLGSWPPLRQLNEKQRLEREVADAAFTERHRDCHAHRWSMEGSRATHCGLCCPPLPLSASQMENISRILKGVTRREEELDVWALSLTCGHRVEREVHHTNRYLAGSTAHCADCGVTRGIVTSERIVEAADRQAEAKRKRETEVRHAEKDVAKAEAAVAEAKRKLAAIQQGARVEK